ncbi:hypothetical protein [Haloplasma contractile]|uniref:Uncharacterized protein n=1 Tax=Haloplasma contractile SSD-17B TaxID=1033810 RepID=U2E9X0_9MOLU|nr:hypothetical protein [Haloplasma contractile]ERJ11641.1 hypothetical protein HLPCO_002342 [Haloplasma contractile SSD-17B]
MKKLIIVSGLIFFLMFNTTRIYAYWKDTSHTYVTEEKPVEIITESMVSDTGKYLVPKGSILGVNDIEEIVFTYEVFVEEGKTLDIKTENLTINGIELSSELSDLFTFTFKQQVIEEDTLTTNFFERSQNGYFVEVTLYLSMQMPSYEQYQTIAGGIMRFDVALEAE